MNIYIFVLSMKTGKGMNPIEFWALVRYRKAG